MAHLDEETQRWKDMSQAVVGLEPAFAADMLRNIGKPTRLRVVRVDGQERERTMDYDEERVNVAVKDGKISSIVNFG